MTKAKHSGPCTYGVELRRRGLLEAGWHEAEQLTCRQVTALWLEVIALIYRDHSLQSISDALQVSYKLVSNDLAAAGVKLRPRGVGNNVTGGKAKSLMLRDKARAITVDATDPKAAIKRQIIDLYTNNGLTQKQICARLSLSATAVSVVLNSQAPRVTPPKRVILDRVKDRAVLRQCPITGGVPTTMARLTFKTLCHRKMFMNREGYCGACRGKITPPLLTLL